MSRPVERSTSVQPGSRPSMGLFRLRFTDPALESAFRQDYFHKSVRQVRISLITGLLLYAIFGALDPHIIPDATRFAWWIRYALVCPAILLAVVLSVYPVFERVMQVTVAGAGLIAGLGIIAMIVAAKPPGSYYYYAGLLLSCAFINTFMRLRFAAAAVATWAIVFVYEALVFERTPRIIFINNTFFLLTINFVTTYACYFMERSVRNEFVQRRTIERQAARLNQALQDVELARREAEEQSHRDPLTELFNRRYFFEVLRHELDSSRHGAAPIAVLMLDLDHFKRINDTYGHAAGDKLLRAVAEVIAAGMRRSDVPCRYGGEEFAILLTQSERALAEDVAQRLHADIAGVCVETPAGALSVTVSIGIAVCLPGETIDADCLMDRADQALYAAKQTGRNRVRAWSPEMAPRPAGA